MKFSFLLKITIYGFIWKRKMVISGNYEVSTFQCSWKFVGPPDMSDKNPLGPINISHRRTRGPVKFSGRNWGRNCIFCPKNSVQTSQQKIHQSKHLLQKAWPAGYRFIVFKTCWSLYLPSLDRVPFYSSWVFAISNFNNNKFLENQI